VISGKDFAQRANIWATEHGSSGGDERNILKKGANYGWPIITYGIDYSGKVGSKKTRQASMEQGFQFFTA
jgi:glucose/arabinose dehydrogenase